LNRYASSDTKKAAAISTHKASARVLMLLTGLASKRKVASNPASN